MSKAVVAAGADGVNSRALLSFDSRAEQYATRSYNGMSTKARKPRRRSRARFVVCIDSPPPWRAPTTTGSTSGGEVFASEDGGASWAERPLPEGATQVYAMGCV